MIISFLYTRGFLYQQLLHHQSKSQAPLEIFAKHLYHLRKVLHEIHLEKMKVNSFKMYVSGRNLATYTKYRGVDPELSNQYGLPLQREVIFGLTIGL